MVLLNDNTVAISSLGAAGVISGVVLKNSMEQLGKKSKFIGPALFIGGWLVFLYAIIKDGLGMNAKTIQAALAVAMIVGSAFYMKNKMAKKETPEWYIAILFPIGWTLLAYTIGLGGLDEIMNLDMDKVFNMKSLLSLGAAGAVLLSMMWALPWQRKKCIVDGPGMPLFTTAWAMLIVANSLSLA